MDRISFLAAAADALQPGDKGYIDYKNKPGYNWKTIRHSKVLLNGKGKIVAGAGGKFKNKTWGAKWKMKKNPPKSAAPKSTLSAAAGALEEEEKTPTTPLEAAAEIAPAPEKETDLPEEPVKAGNEVDNQIFTLNQIMENSSPDSQKNMLAESIYYDVKYNGMLFEDALGFYKDKHNDSESQAALEEIEKAVKGEEQSPLEQAAETAPDPSEFKSQADKAAFNVLTDMAKEDNGVQSELAQEIIGEMVSSGSFAEAYSTVMHNHQDNLTDMDFMDVIAEKVENQAGSHNLPAEPENNSLPQSEEEKLASIKDMWVKDKYGYNYGEPVLWDLMELMKDGTNFKDAFEKVKNHYAGHEGHDEGYDDVLKGVYKDITGKELEGEAEANEPAAPDQDDDEEFMPGGEKYHKIFQKFMQAEDGSTLEHVADAVINQLKMGNSYENAIDAAKLIWGYQTEFKDAVKELNQAVYGQDTIPAKAPAASHLEQAAAAAPEHYDLGKAKELAKNMAFVHGHSDVGDMFDELKSYLNNNDSVTEALEKFEKDFAGWESVQGLKLKELTEIFKNQVKQNSSPEPAPDPTPVEQPKPNKPKVTKAQKLAAGKSKAEQMASQTNSVNAKVAGAKYLEALEENPNATALQVLKAAKEKIKEYAPDGAYGSASSKVDIDKATKYLDDIKAEIKNAGTSALQQAATISTSFSSKSYTPEAKAKAINCHGVYESKKKFMPDFEKAWAKCSEDEKKSAIEYTHSYSKYNEPLRGIEYGTSSYKGVGNIDFDKIGVNGYGHFKPGYAKKLIQDLTKAIDKSEYKEDIHLRRGVDFDGMDKFFQLPKDIDDYSVEELQNLLTGNKYTEHGFMSCGAAAGTGFDRDIDLQIYAPAGSKMLYVEDISYYKDHGENEMLLQRGTQFQVKKVSKVNGKLTIEMDIVGYNMQKV